MKVAPSPRVGSGLDVSAMGVHDLAGDRRDQDRDPHVPSGRRQRGRTARIYEEDLRGDTRAMIANLDLGEIIRPAQR